MKAAAPKKGALGSIKSAAEGIVSRAGGSAAGRLLSRIPFLAKRSASVPEPFSAIEDDTPISDLLSSANVAPGMASGSTKRESVDFRALVELAIKTPVLLVGIVVVLVFVLAIAVTSLIVGTPPKAPTAAVPFTPRGEALVKTWLPPPGDPFEPRMAYEREGKPEYSAEDAARIGIDPNPLTMAALRDKNDEAIDELYGTVP